MRLKTRLSVSLSTTTAEEEDVASVRPGAYEVTDALGEGSSRTYKVLNGADEETLDLAGLAEVNFVYLRTNKPVTLHLGDGVATADVPVHVPDGQGYGYLVMNTSGITSLSVSNASGQTARLMVILAGDEE